MAIFEGARSDCNGSVGKTFSNPDTNFELWNILCDYVEIPNLQADAAAIRNSRETAITALHDYAKTKYGNDAPMKTREVAMKYSAGRSERLEDLTDAQLEKLKKAVLT